MKKALVTGIAGFAGSHLTELLLKEKLQVFGFYHPDHATGNIDHIKSKINLIPADLSQSEQIFKEVKKINPDFVFHLAAFSSPSISFQDPKTTFENNVFGQLNLLESLSKISSNARILIVGSAEEYGNVDPKYLPAGEQTPLAPQSPYAVSKVAQDMLGYQFFLHEKLKCVRVRPFNHIGPRQSKDFVVSAFASQIAELEKRGGGQIKVGNLESDRDFTDVRDMVKAYYLALTKGEPGEVYNIGSGTAVKIAKILDDLLSFSKFKIKVAVDKSRYHPVDLKILLADPSKFKKQTGWKPTIPLNQTLFDTMEYERQKLK